MSGLREDQHEAIEHVLTHHRLAIAAVPYGDRSPRLLGWVTADARAAFGCIGERGSMRADEVAEALGWAESRAEQALDALSIHRLVRRDGNLHHPLPIA